MLGIHIGIKIKIPTIKVAKTRNKSCQTPQYFYIPKFGIFVPSFGIFVPSFGIFIPGLGI